jgi:phage shock protein PspC (stress-responsive transcriptional regulator)
MAEKNDYEAQRYRSAASLVRVQGILSIIFGGLGLLVAFFLVLLFLAAMSESNSYQVISASITALIVFIFGVLPHIFLVVSGVHLLREPRPAVARTLIIINLVIGALFNLVIVVFAIINLVQMSDYDHGYKKHHTK